MLKELDIPTYLDKTLPSAAAQNSTAPEFKSTAPS